MPSPDLVILLDLPVVEAQQLIGQKQTRSYTTQKADLQEADAGYLEEVRAVYLELARQSHDWHKIDCLEKGTLRSVDEIGDEIWKIVEACRNG